MAARAIEGQAAGYLLDYDHREEIGRCLQVDSHLSKTVRTCRILMCGARSFRKCSPELVITTGTAGGIGKDFEVGDVIVSSVVRFDCIAKFKSKPFALAHYTSAAAKITYFTRHGRCSRPMRHSFRKTTNACRRLSACRRKR